MIIKFDELSNIDLIQNAIYEGGISNNYGSDPLIKLFKIEGCEKGIGSSGGFRKALKEFNDKLVEEMKFHLFLFLVQLRKEEIKSL